MECPPLPTDTQTPRALLAEAAEARRRGDLAAAAVAEIDAQRLARAAGGGGGAMNRHHHPLDALRLQRGAEHLHDLGPRAMAEFFHELAAQNGGMPATLALLNEYQRRLSPAMLTLVGGDRFPPRPLRTASAEARA